MLQRTIDYVCYCEQSITCATANNRLRVTANNRLRVLQRTIDYVCYGEQSITWVTTNNRLHVLLRTIDYMCYCESIKCVTANNLLYVLRRTIYYMCCCEQSITCVLRTIDYNLYTLFDDLTHEQSIIIICYSKQLNTICLNHVHCLHGAE